MYSTEYSRLAEGFLHGRTSMLLKPPPALLALPDPYDPNVSRLLRKHDTVLFNRKYYLYWGPAPALLVAAACWMLGISNPLFGDEYMVLVFGLGTIICALILLFQFRSRLFPHQRISVITLATLSLGLGAPILYMLARGAVYEQAIIAGQFFLLAGLCTTWFGLKDEKPHPILLTATGILWALAVASRISLPPAVIAMTLLTLWQIRRHPRTMIALLTPLVMGAALLAYYNFARFHNVFETGHRYQLASTNQHAENPWSFLSVKYLIPNFLNYLLAPPERINAFPYLWAFGQPPPFSDLLHLPRSIGYEGMVGIIWGQPFLLFGFFARRRSATDTPPDRRVVWLLPTLTTGTLLSFAPVLLMNMTTMRYMLDLVPIATLVAALGYWCLLDRLTDRPRLKKEITTAARLAVAAQCLIGFLVAWSGYYGHFVTYNPALHNALRNLLPKHIF